MGHGMLGPGMMVHGMMGHGMMGHGMMGHGMMGHGMMGPGMMMGNCGFLPMPTRELTAEDVRHMLTWRLQAMGNKRLKLGDVKEADSGSIVADIVTVDDSLVERLKIDRRNGWIQQTE
jgi:hypothetical protein